MRWIVIGACSFVILVALRQIKNRHRIKSFDQLEIHKEYVGLRAKNIKRLREKKKKPQEHKSLIKELASE